MSLFSVELANQSSTYPARHGCFVVFLIILQLFFNYFCLEFNSFNRQAFPVFLGWVGIPPHGKGDRQRPHLGQFFLQSSV
jgi:hypothetical protein